MGFLHHHHHPHGTTRHQHTLNQIPNQTKHPKKKNDNQTKPNQTESESQAKYDPDDTGPTFPLTDLRPQPIEIDHVSTLFIASTTLGRTRSGQFRAKSDIQMARTRPGTDLPTRLERLLSQTEGQWCDAIPAVEERSDGEELPRRVTVREVLKYSLTWVIIPSVTVQAWTQAMERSESQPSATTMAGPSAASDCGSKRNGGDESSSAAAAPVSKRIKNWSDGGPWNHQSRSGESRRWTLSTSREFRASYSARTRATLFPLSSRAS